jgi:Fe2+ transport system protein FeoA
VQGRVAARGRKRPSREAGKQVAVRGVVQGTTGGDGLAGAGMERYLCAVMERGGQDLVELGLIKDDARLRKRTNAELWVEMEQSRQRLVEMGLIKDDSRLRKKSEPELFGELARYRQNLVNMGLIKDRSLTGLKGRSEMGGASIPKAPRDGVLTDAGLVEVNYQTASLYQGTSSANPSPFNTRPVTAPCLVGVPPTFCDQLLNSPN